LFERRGGRGDPLLPSYAREYSRPRRWTITASLGGHGNIGVAWNAGDSTTEAIESFLSFLEDDELVRSVSPEEIPRPGWRRLHVMFQGQHKEIVFRSDWVAGFTIE
jgi:hypothetical protein